MKNEKCLVVIQSRFSSSRLPGKAIFPINGIPLVVLVALRAGNTGKDVLVATSIETTDDELCLILDKYGINYFRGDLNNVLSRFNEVVKHLDNEDLVFRLTADNVLPDGHMLEEMEEEYIKSDYDILNCTTEQSNLPYGVTAELMKVKHIRDAYQNAKSSYEKEHVTPYMYNKYKHGYFKSKKIFGLSNFRLTIDTFDDYISVKSLFKGSKDIINDSTQQLMNNFKGMKYRPFYEKAKKQMTLGTAQFGMHYGISNVIGKISEDESIEIIKNAITEGIEYIDTASAYGNSEKVLGKALKSGWRERVKIITKLNPFDEIDTCIDETIWKFATRSSVLNSCLNLGVDKIDVLMLHRADHLNKANGSIINELYCLKEEGIIDEIGISIQTPLELKEVLCQENISIIQIPFNILDYRWEDLIPDIIKEKKKRKVLIHARSSLLQGLLPSEEKLLWNKAHIDDNKEITNWLTSTYKEMDKMSITDLCIGYVNSQPWIDSVVIGVDSLSHLYSNLQSISMPLIDVNNLHKIDLIKPKVPKSTLNPSEWIK